MCHFRTLSWKRLVVKGLRSHGIQRERKLIPPAELEPSLAERIVPTLKTKQKIASVLKFKPPPKPEIHTKNSSQKLEFIPSKQDSNLGKGVLLRKICSVSGDLVSNDTSFHVISVGETKMLLRRDIAQQRSPQSSNIRCTDSRRDVVVARSDVRRERTESVEWSFVAPIQLLLHVLRDLVKWDMPGPFVHHLNVLLPSSPRKVTFTEQRNKLRHTWICHHHHLRLVKRESQYLEWRALRIVPCRSRRKWSQGEGHRRWKERCHTRCRCPRCHPSACTRNSPCGARGTTSHVWTRRERRCQSCAGPSWG